MTPIELYRIVTGDRVWTMTSSAESVTYNNDFYAPTAVGRTMINQKREISKENVDVELPLDHPLAVELLTSFLDQIMTVTVFQKQDGVIEVMWKGRLASIQPGEATLKLIFESIFTSMRRPGLRARFQKICRHALYGRGCNLDPADFATAGTVTALSGTTLTVTEAASEASGFYTGGMVAADNGILSFIIGHSGSTLVLQRMSSSLATQWAVEGSGTGVTIYPGCDHARTTCHTKFDNVLNYGGFDWIPRKNPLGGSSII